jgi:gingipain R
MNKKTPIAVILGISLFFTHKINAQQALNNVTLGSGETSIKTTSEGKKLKITVNTGQATLHYDKASGGYLAGIYNGVPILNQGAPDIQKLSYAINVPTDKGAIARIVSSDVETYENYYIAPSLGNITRDQKPSGLTRKKGPIYSQNNFYPATNISMGDVYQVRKEFGQAISIVPFQYNPVTKTLKVYRNIVIEVTFADPAQKKSVENTEWTSVLQHHFINYAPDESAQSKTRFAPIPESGNLLIVTKAKNLPTLQSFIKWKKQKGIHTYVLNVDTLTGGSSATNIRLYIKNKYEALNLSYVLLIGDNTDIAPVHDATLAGPSDAAYAYVAGNDHYPDLMVGRFSAETTDELKVQITRTIAYEKTPALNQPWYKRAIGVASNQGPGDNNEYDWEHIRNIRTKLMAAGGGYTQVSELYDSTHGGQDAAGDPTPVDLKNALNNGSTLVNYCGHGSYDFLVTTGFSIQDVPELTNDNGAWPLVWGVACISGDFENQTCLGEQLLRQKRAVSGKPSGAIAAFFSTINQSWDPPMRAQDAYVDLIVNATNANQNTIGTLTTTGTMSMNDAYTTDGFDMTDTWVLFGDPTVKLQTRKLDTMIVSHVATLNKNATQVNLNINVPGAKAVLYYQDSILSVATAAGGTSHHTFPAVTVLDSIWVTVTADFHKPYSGYIKVVNVTGIDEQENHNNSLSLYPNPATTTITLKGIAEDCTYRCYGANGIFVFEGNARQSKNTINISGLAAGQYFLKVEGKSTKKSMPFQVLK